MQSGNNDNNNIKNRSIFENDIFRASRIFINTLYKWNGFTISINSLIGKNIADEIINLLTIRNKKIINILTIKNKEVNKDLCKEEYNAYISSIYNLKEKKQKLIIFDNCISKNYDNLIM